MRPKGIPRSSNNNNNNNNNRKMDIAQSVLQTVKNSLETYFQQHEGDIAIPPTLHTFQPAKEGLLGSLWKPGLTVPARQSLSQQDGFISKWRPNLLLHGLNNEKAEFSQPLAENHICTAQKHVPSFLYGTSGVGKTRTVFEYLSKNKGFYFLSDDFMRNPGSNDLVNSLDCNLQTAGNDTLISEQNRIRIRNRVSMLLFIRYVVHEKLEEIFKERLKRGMNPYEWLLYQIFPELFLGKDVFPATLVACDVASVEGMIRFEYWAETNVTWSVFVDEAQALLNLNTTNFLSKNGEKSRSAFSALMGGFGDLAKKWNYLHYPVFCGTGLSFDQFSEQTLSIVGKALGDEPDVFFADFKLLGVEHVEQYLGRILDLTDLCDDVVKHVANWLRGRPRWTASFLEVYSSRQEKVSANQVWRTQGDFEGNSAKLIEALDRYLNVMTRKEESNTNRRETWSAGGSSAYACFERVRREIADATGEDQRRFLGKVQEDLQYTVCRFAVGQNPHPFIDADAKLLIKNGVAAVCETERQGVMIKGHIDEPIVIQSGINFFDLDDFLRENLIKQESGGLGAAFEKLLLPGLLMEKDRLRNFLRKHLDKGGASALEPYGVPRKSAYGVYCVDTGGDIDATLQWLRKSIEAKFEGQVAPFCYPDVHMGPDVVFLLRHRTTYLDFRSCVLESKYQIEMSNQQDALRTMVPEKFYRESRGKEKEKVCLKMTADQGKKWDDLAGKFVSNERPCLRMLVQTPAKPTAAAVSGRVPANGTGPNSKNKGEKRDWLVVVNTENVGQLFSERSSDVIKLLKKGKRKRPVELRANSPLKSSNDAVAIDSISKSLGRLPEERNGKRAQNNIFINFFFED